MKLPPLPDPTIDLRSDTLTTPTVPMREAMLAAPVGDDVYGEDPTVNALEARVAELLGHEAGLFVPTGSMGNLLGVWTLVRRGEEVLCDVQAHIARAELGAHAVLHGVTMRTWTSPHGVADTDTVLEQIAAPTPYLVSTAAVAFENTHNFGGGTIQPLDHLQEVSAACRERGVGMHLDGARLWNAHIATGVPLADYASLFDTVSVCFSKGLGAPVGSMLVSSRERIDRARVQRKRLGGGMRQIGMLAAAADYALDHHLQRLSDDHAHAAAFAAAVAAKAPGAVTEPQTNIVVLSTGSRPAPEVVTQAARLGIRLSALGTHTVRAVTYLGISEAEAVQAGDLVGTLLSE